MTRRLHRIFEAVEPWEDAASALSELPELPDQEIWSAPDRLSADDCFDHLGADWRGPVRPHDPEDEQ